MKKKTIDKYISVNNEVIKIVEEKSDWRTNGVLYVDAEGKNYNAYRVEVFTLEQILSHFAEKLSNYNELEEYVYEMKCDKRIKELEKKYKCKFVTTAEDGDSNYGSYVEMKCYLKWGKEKMLIYRDYRQIKYKELYETITSKDFEKEIKLFIHDNICNGGKK